MFTDNSKMLFRGSMRYLLIVLGILLPLTLLSSLLLVEQNKRIALLETQNHGVHYLQGIQPILDGLPEHRGLINLQLHENYIQTDHLIKLQQKIDFAMISLEEFNEKYKGEFETKEQFQKLKNDWKAIRSYWKSLSVRESLEAHNDLIEDITNLTKQVVEKSNLNILASQDSHHLLNATVNELPLLLDDLGQIRTASVEILYIINSKGFSKSELKGLEDSVNVLGNRIKYNNDRLISLLNKITIKDVDYLPNDLSTLLTSSTYQFLGIIDYEILDKDSSGISIHDFYNEGKIVLGNIARIHDSLLAQLVRNIEKEYINARIDFYVISLALSLIGLLVIYLCIRLIVTILKLKYSDSRLQMIFETALDAIIVIDNNGLIQAFNSSAEKIFGYERMEVIGKNVNILMPEPMQSEHGTYINNYLATGDAKIIGQGRESFGKRKDGSFFPINVSINTTTVNGNRMFVGLVSDVTERKVAEQELLLANSFMVSLLSNLQDGIVVEDDNHKVIQVNQRFCDMFGFTHREINKDQDKNEAIRRPTMWLADPDAFIQHVNKCLLNQVIETNHELTLIDGRVFELDYVPVFIEHENKKTYRGHLWSYRDITDHKNTEARLQQQSHDLKNLAIEERCLRELLHFSLQPTDLKKFIDNALRALFTSIAWSKIEQRGAVFLTENKGRGQRMRMISKYNMDYNVSDNNGIKDHYILPLKQVEDLLGVLIIYLPGLHISGSIKIGFLQQVAEILSIGIERRYANELLIHAKLEAESAVKTKSLFLANMSHEIRTPLNGVLGMLHLLGKTDLSQRQLGYVNTASSSGEMLLTVINNVLDFTKIEVGKLVLEKIPFDLIAVLEETATLMTKAAYDKGLELVCLLDHTLPRYVKGDPNRLQQVMTNLVSNAIKFTETGEVVVYAKPRGNNILFGVSDTGIGLNKEQQQQIFSPFTQADSSHTRKYGGTGLGLAISARLVEVMGGKLDVKSKPNYGSDFSFNIFFDIVGSDAKNNEPLKEFLGMRILFVGNNYKNADAFGQMTKRWQINHVDYIVDSNLTADNLLSSKNAADDYGIIFIDLGIRLGRQERADLIMNIQKMKCSTQAKIVIIYPLTDSQSYDGGHLMISKPLRQSDVYNTLYSLTHDTLSTGDHAQEYKQISTWRFNSGRVLLVEDNIVNQEVAKEIMTNAGLTVDVCHNGLSALVAVQEYKYDAILMDIQMPIMDGYEATLCIRALDKAYEKLPIIAMTAHAFTEDMDKGIALGMNGYVSKPINPDKLFEELARFITPEGKSNTADTNKETVIHSHLSINVPGINVNNGLSRIGGSMDAYLRILNTYKNRNAQLHKEIIKSIDKDNLTEAMRLAHTLKGSSGNIGAEELYQLASKLEMACKDGDHEEIKVLTEQVREKLDEVLQGIDKLTSEATQGSDDREGENTDPVSINHLIAALEKIDGYLNNDIREAQKCLDEIVKKTKGTEYHTETKEIYEVLNGFDIDKTKSKLKDFNDRLLKKAS